MSTKATEVMKNMLRAAEEKKAQINDMVKQLYKGKEDAKDKLRKDQAKVPLKAMSKYGDVGSQLHEVLKDEKLVLDVDKELHDAKLRLVDAEHKVSDIKRWMTKTEYGDEQQQEEAISMAKQSLQEM